MKKLTKKTTILVALFATITLLDTPIFSMQFSDSNNAEEPPQQNLTELVSGYNQQHTRLTRTPTPAYGYPLHYEEQYLLTPAHDPLLNQYLYHQYLYHNLYHEPSSDFYSQSRNNIPHDRSPRKIGKKRKYAEIKTKEQTPLEELEQPLKKRKFTPQKKRARKRKKKKKKKVAMDDNIAMNQQQGEKIRCDNCRGLYSNKGSLSQHLRDHCTENHDKPSYTCEGCDKSLSNKSNLTRHRKTCRKIRELLAEAPISCNNEGRQSSSDFRFPSIDEWYFTTERSS